MKIIIIAILIVFNLYADAKDKMFNLYENKNYKSACNVGFANLKSYNEDEHFLSLYAFSCLKADFIDRLSTPAVKLKFSPEARLNGAYFSIILMQKKLLYHSLVDGYDLSAFNMPSTDYVLSKVFDAYSKLGKHKAKEFYIFQDKDDKKLSYKLYLQKAPRIDKMVIEEIYDTITTKRHIYW
jgi:hypothetical protein